MVLLLLACSTPPERQVVIRAPEQPEDTGTPPDPSLFVRGQVLGGGWTRAILHADFDNDGDNDLFAVNDRPSKLWRNDGTGFFHNVPEGYGSYDGRDGAVGDVDGDGFIDVVIANGQGPIEVLRGDGQGFELLTVLNEGGPIPFAIAMTDIDLDGHLDIYVATDDATDLLWLNNGNGTFKLGDPPLVADTRARDVVATDIDGDGDDDLVVFNAFAPNQIYRNDGGELVYGGRVCERGGEQAVVGDVDGDGDIDFVCLQPRRDRMVTWLSVGPLSFDTYQGYRSVNTLGLSLGDIDEDGFPDLAVAREGRNRVYFNNGSGRFVDSGERLGEDGTNHIALVDIDGDGDLDLIEANDYARPNLVWFYAPEAIDQGVVRE